MDVSRSSFDLVVLGGGPTGIGCASAADRLGKRVLLIERESKLGGLARQIECGGYAIDPGGHRLLCSHPEQFDFWNRLARRAGVNLVEVSRCSSIYWAGSTIDYPINWDQFRGALPWMFRIRVGISAIIWRLIGDPSRSLADYGKYYYGGFLHSRFMSLHTQKVFGRSGRSLSASWARQRIAAPRLFDILRAALPWSAKTRVEGKDFYLYPGGGLGRLWAGLEGALSARSRVEKNARLCALRRREDDGTWVVDVELDGELATVQSTSIISTVPPEVLLELLGESSLASQFEASFERRNLVVVLVHCPELAMRWTHQQWIYLHDKCIRCSRIQNYQNWTGLNIADPILGMEYNVGADTDDSSVESLVRESAIADLQTLSVSVDNYAVVGTVAIPNAYLNFGSQSSEFANLDQTLRSGYPGLITTGRQGAGLYINLDQSLRLGQVCAELPATASGVHGLEYGEYQERV
ncbi:NAD(P)-binding protein [Amycolatopsis japonica]